MHKSSGDGVPNIFTQLHMFLTHLLGWSWHQHVVLTSLCSNLVTLSHATFRMTTAILRPWARCKKSLKQQSVVAFVCSCSFLAYAWPNKECTTYKTWEVECGISKATASTWPVAGKRFGHAELLYILVQSGIVNCYLVCGWMVSACVLYSAYMSCVPSGSMPFWDWWQLVRAARSLAQSAGTDSGSEAVWQADVWVWSVLFQIAVCGVLYRAARGEFIHCILLDSYSIVECLKTGCALFREALGIRVCCTWVLCTYLHE